MLQHFCCIHGIYLKHFANLICILRTPNMDNDFVIILHLAKMDERSWLAIRVV